MTTPASSFTRGSSETVRGRPDRFDQATAETYIIAATMKAPQWVQEYGDVLDPGLFTDSTRRAIFEAARKVMEEDGTVDDKLVAGHVVEKQELATERIQAEFREVEGALADPPDRLYERATEALAQLRRPIDLHDARVEMTRASSAATLPELLDAAERVVATFRFRSLDPLTTAGAAQPVLTCLADVEPVELEWLWPTRFPSGKLSLIAGHPGLGKSFLSLDMAARITDGRAWPDQRNEPRTPRSVVILSAEDDVADTIRPRLDRAGADPRRVHVLEGVHRTSGAGPAMLDLTSDLPAIDKAIRRIGDVSMVVIDPLSAYLGPTDSHRDADVRSVLGPLAALASRHGVAIIGVTHLNKGQVRTCIHRVLGSVGIAAACRAVWLVARDPQDHGRRLLLPVKMNLAPDSTGLAYSIVHGALNWGADPVTVTADDILAAEVGNGPDDDGGHEVAEWLRDELADGPKPVKEVEKRARPLGFSAKQLRSARKPAGVKPKRLGFGPGGTWYLALPDHTWPPDSIGDKGAQQTGGAPKAPMEEHGRDAT
ncbi:MAG: AAA family ATPase [Planctomycetota bacterium]|jgi:hypothetical protein